MALWNRRKAQPTEAIVAAARVITGADLALGNTGQTNIRTADAGDIEVFEFYADSAGLLHHAANYSADALGLVELFMYDLDALGRPVGPTKNPDVARLVTLVLGSLASRQHMLRQVGLLLFLVGRAYIAIPVSGGQFIGEDVEVYSGLVLRPGTDGSWLLKTSDGETTLSASEYTVVEISTPLPHDPARTDSPAKSALPAMRQKRLLRWTENSILINRVASRAVWLIAAEASLPGGVDAATGAKVDGLLQLGRQFAEAQTAAIKDPRSPEGMAGPIIQAPLEVVKDGIKRIDPNFELNSVIGEQMDRADLELARTLALPEAVVLGTSQSTHWSAATALSDTARSYIAPTASTLVHSLQRALFSAVLKANGFDGPAQYALGFDASALHLAVDAGRDALQAHLQGALSDEALLRVLNFDPADIATPEQKARQAGTEVAPVGDPGPDARPTPLPRTEPDAA